MIRTPHRTTSTVSMASRPSLPNLRSRRTVSRQPRRMTPTTLTPSRITTKRTTDSKATRPRLTTNPPTPSPPTRSSRHTASPSHRPDTPRSRNWQPVCLASSWAASACTTSTWATPARPWHSTRAHADDAHVRMVQHRPFDGGGHVTFGNHRTAEATGRALFQRTFHGMQEIPRSGIVPVHHRPSRRRHLGTGGRHPDSVLPLRLAMAP